MRWMWPTTLLALTAVVVLGGCDRRTIYRDFPVEFDTVQDNDWQNESPRLIAGVYEEQLFRTLNDSDELRIIHGFQGGVWVHLSIRTFGVPTEGTMDASIEPGVGQTDLLLRLVRSPEGFQEAYDIPIPIAARGAELDALDGSSATLNVEFTAGGLSISQTLPVILRGP